MSLSTHTVLVAAVDQAEKSGEPVSERALAESLAVRPPALSDRLDSLCAFDLLVETDRGYRPAITAHELLAADIDLEDALVLDVVEE